MNLPGLCIKRPVLATVMSLVIVLIGLVCYERLSVRDFLTEARDIGIVTGGPSAYGPKPPGAAGEA